MIRLCTVALACSLTLTVYAAQTGQKATFESLDRNSDGKISINEATDDDSLFIAFKNLDRDRDGQLTREEFAGFERDKRGAATTGR